MSLLLKKCDTRNRLSSSSRKNRSSSRKVGQDPIAKCSEIMPNGPRATRLSFLEDYTLDHSSHGQRIAAIEIAGIF